MAASIWADSSWLGPSAGWASGTDSSTSRKRSSDVPLGRYDDRAVSLALARNWLAERRLPSGRMRFGGVRTPGNR
jgi:hypothetical protein